MPTFRDLTFGTRARTTPRYHTADLMESVQACVRRLYSRDYSLIERGVHEMALTFRLGMYLQKAFPQYDVDCEYNRNVREPKRTPYNAQGHSTRPDILIHRREQNFPTNLVLLEAKRVGDHISPYDLRKVRYFVHGDRVGNPYRYQLGVVLLLKPTEFEMVFVERDAQTSDAGS